jgi:hypothetical protein
MTEHPEDLPWNDVPADSDVPPGSEEPDPAEVVGDEDDPAKRDLSQPRTLELDENRRESIDERLAEEEPDRAARAEEPEAGELQSPESGDSDVEGELAEPDQADPAEREDLPAEEAAVRVVDDDDV